jgi:hypothetical protein
MKAEYLFEDYKLKLDYVKGQYERLWQRFSFFLTLELALFGFLGYLTLDAQRFDVGKPAATLLPGVLGLVAPLLWYVVGAQDRRLVEVYRDRANQAAEAFAQHPDGLPNYGKSHAAADIPAGWNDVRSWYSRALSMTRLPATIALALVVVWLMVIFGWRNVTQGLPVSGKGAATILEPTDDTLRLACEREGHTRRQ